MHGRHCHASQFAVLGMWPVDNFKLSSCDSRGAALSGIAESDTKKRASQIPNLIYKWDLEGKLSDFDYPHRQDVVC